MVWCREPWPKFNQMYLFGGQIYFEYVISNLMSKKIENGRMTSFYPKQNHHKNCLYCMCIIYYVGYLIYNLCMHTTTHSTSLHCGGLLHDHLYALVYWLMIWTKGVLCSVYALFNLRHVVCLMLVWCRLFN